jgi:accessory gene regulator protein AgrB
MCNDFFMKADKWCMYHVTLRHIHINIVAMEKQQVLYSMSVCVCVCVCVCVRARARVRAFLPYLSGLHIAHFLCCVIVSCVAFLATPYFATLTRKWHGFQKKNYKM